MRARLLAPVALLGLLPLAAPASPGLTRLTPDQMEAQATLVVEGTLVSHEIKTDAARRTEQVTVKVTAVEGKAKGAVKVGRALALSASCAPPQPPAEGPPRPERGYPGDTCRPGSLLPAALQVSPGEAVRIPLAQEKAGLVVVSESEPAHRVVSVRPVR